MSPRIKLEELKSRVVRLGQVEQRLKMRARVDMLASAALVVVRVVLENAQQELHRHVTAYDIRS